MFIGWFAHDDALDSETDEKPGKRLRSMASPSMAYTFPHRQAHFCLLYCMYGPMMFGMNWPMAIPLNVNPEVKISFGRETLEVSGNIDSILSDVFWTVMVEYN